VSSEEEVGRSPLARSTSAGTALSGKKTPTASTMDSSKLDANAKQASCEMEEEIGGEQIQPWTDESLETNVLEESTNRMDLTSIVNNLDKFVLGLFYS
jgi:hypothetical protein